MNKKLLLILSLGFTSYNLCPPVRILHTSDSTAVTISEELVNFSHTLRNHASDCPAEPDGMLPFDLNGKFSSTDLTNCIHYLNVLDHGQDIVPLLQEQDLAANCQLLKIVDFFDIPQLYAKTVTEIAHKLALPTTLNEFRTRPDFMERFAGLPTHDIFKELKLHAPFSLIHTPTKVPPAKIRGWLAFDPHRNRIVTTSSGHTAHVLDTHTDEQLVILQGHTNTAYTAALSPDGNRIITGSHGGAAHVWDARTGLQLTCLDNSCNAAALNPGGNRIVTLSNKYTGCVWENVFAAIKDNNTDVLAQSLFILLLENAQRPITLDQAHLHNIFDTFSVQEQLHIINTYRPQNLGAIRNLRSFITQHPRLTTAVGIGIAAAVTAKAIKNVQKR